MKKNKIKQSRKGLKRWKQLRFVGKVWRVAWVGVLAVWGFTILQVLFCSVFNPPLTPLMVKRYFEQKKDDDRVVTFERDYVPIEEISPTLIKAINIAEDGGGFVYHRGFDVYKMMKAVQHNDTTDCWIGGSTITQQTAKNCFLTNKKTWLRKILEAHYTVLMEAVWGKKRIMECYINVIEFGDGIYGCEAACQHYYGHSAQYVTALEAAQLVTILPSPLSRDPNYLSPKYREKAQKYVNKISKEPPTDWSCKRSELSPWTLARYRRQLPDFLKWLAVRRWRQMRGIEVP